VERVWRGEQVTGPRLSTNPGLGVPLTDHPGPDGTVKPIPALALHCVARPAAAIDRCCAHKLLP
jgi:hypothetical protein